MAAESCRGTASAACLVDMGRTTSGTAGSGQVTAAMSARVREARTATAVPRTVACGRQPTERRTTVTRPSRTEEGHLLLCEHSLAERRACWRPVAAHVLAT